VVPTAVKTSGSGTASVVVVVVDFLFISIDFFRMAAAQTKPPLDELTAHEKRVLRQRNREGERGIREIFTALFIFPFFLPLSLSLAVHC
jgi:hypothetical protein